MEEKTSASGITDEERLYVPRRGTNFETVGGAQNSIIGILEPLKIGRMPTRLPGDGCILPTSVKF